MKKIKGIIAPTLTFFDIKGNVDKEKCKKHMKWMLDRGINGLFVTGTYGSGYLMSLSERIQIFELACKTVEDYEDAFVIAHVGCPDTKSSVILTNEANKCGVQAVSAITPFNYKYTEEELVGYYKALVDQSDVPVFAYNNPGATNIVISYEMVKKLKEIGIKGLKDSSVNVELAKQIINDNKISGEDFKYISGTTTGWISLQELGIDTMIAGMCNYAPEVVEALYKSSFIDKEKAAKTYKICVDLGAKIKIGNSLLSSHIVLQARGFDAGFMRLPLNIDYSKYQQKIKEDEFAVNEAMAKLNII